MVTLVDERNGICGGMEVTVVETHGLDCINLPKEENVLEVAVGPRSRWGMLVVGMMDSNEWKYESLI